MVCWVAAVQQQSAVQATCLPAACSPWKQFIKEPPYNLRVVSMVMTLATVLCILQASL